MQNSDQWLELWKVLKGYICFMARSSKDLRYIEVGYILSSYTITNMDVLFYYNSDIITYYCSLYNKMLKILLNLAATLLHFTHCQ